MKNKIGLITCHRIPNHGSFLQAWSLCEYLCELGYDVEIIDYIYPNLYHLNNVHHNEIRRNTDTSNLFMRLKRYVIDRWFVCNRKRGWELAVYRFLNLLLRNPNKLYFRQLKLSAKSYTSSSELIASKLDYDILISGSDQVWNPRFSGNDGIFFLQFGNRDVKRVAYSSSFGVSEIGDAYKAQYAEWLGSFSHIATREQSGTVIVKDIVGRQAVHVLDPVMLFSRRRWAELLQESKYVEKKTEAYIVTYCLDYVYKGIIDYADAIMQRIAENKGLECATLYKSNLGAKKVKTYSETIHPFEFVNTIMHADFAIVSSFHGLAFCILFHTPFLVVMDSRETSDSRLLDLLDTFCLKDRVLITGEEFDVRDLKDIDWNRVDSIYNQMSEISKRYLKNALNG